MLKILPLEHVQSIVATSSLDKISYQLGSKESRWLRRWRENLPEEEFTPPLYLLKGTKKGRRQSLGSFCGENQ
jgi:hypothetical protein